MFGILATDERETGFSGRTALRLRPGRGLICENEVYRTALYRTVTVSVPSERFAKLREKRLCAALNLLKSKGVRTAIVPEELRGAAKAAGLLPTALRPAYDACLSRVVLEGCRALALAPNEACLAVSAQTISYAAAMQILTLARTLRTVRIAGNSSEALRRQLWRTCGIVDRGPMPKGAAVIGLTLEGGKAPEGCLLTLDLEDPEKPPENGLRPALLPPAGAMAKLPENVDPTAFSAALLQTGTVQPREISASALDIAQGTQYNKEIAIDC